jgi:outer membrane protein TolC
MKLNFLQPGKYSFSVFVALVLIFSTNSFLIAQHSLDFYLSNALKNNPSLNENINSIKIRNLDKSLVEAEYNYPKITLTSNYLFSPYFNNNGKIISANPEEQAIGYDIGITNGGVYSVLFNIEKNIFNGGTIDAYNNQTELQIKNEEENIELLKHNLTKDVTEQYIVSLQSQKLYDLNKSIADTLEKQLRISEAFVKNGFIKQSDFLLLKIEVENQKNSSRQLLSNCKTNLLELNSLCGLNDTAFINLDDVELTNASTINSFKFLRQFTTDSLLAINQQEIIETKYLPQVSLFFNSGLNAIELNNIQRKFGLNAGINFSLPLFDGNQKDLTHQQYQISLSTIQGYKENQKIQILNKLKDVNIQLKSLEGNLKSIKEQINNYILVIQFSEKELMQGQKSMIEYLTIIKNYFELKKNELNTEYDIQRTINQYNYWNW